MLGLRLSFDEDISNGWTFLDTYDHQSGRMNYFDVRFGWGSTSISRRHLTGYVILFSGPIEIRANYGDCFATAIIVV